MTGLQTLNWILYIAFLVCIWDMPIGHFFITMVVAVGYGMTERWLGEEKEKVKK
jgi:hypothetical protein